jgi:hypothetical protein
MKRHVLPFLCSIILFAAVLTHLLSCDQSFDLPGNYTDPDIVPDLTIRALKAMHTFSGKFDVVQEDKIISGIVVADDRSGNFYKSIVIQDTSGGITVCLNGTALFNDYPVGRKVYVKVKGLLLYDYRGLVQLGAGIDLSDPADLMLAGIAPALFSRYLVKGSLQHTITPVVVTREQLTTGMQDRFQNTLVQLKDVELSAADTGISYANVMARQSRSMTLQTCAGPSLVLRNSAYASFAGIIAPVGHGTVTGIYTVFGSAKQLMIRDTGDVHLSGLRCGRTDTSTVTEEEPPEPAYTEGITLAGTSPLLYDFDLIASGLPKGVSVRTGVTATDTGVVAVFTPVKANWNNTGGGFKNFASAASLTALADANVQAAAVNRAIGVRQVTATDKGVAFVFQINNTTGKKNIVLRCKLQSLDASVNRTSNWIVDYGIGAVPASFIPVATLPAALVTGNAAFSNIVVQVNLPATLHNKNRRVWIRIATLSATAGGGSRASTGLDDMEFSWE